MGFLKKVAQVILECTKVLIGIAPVVNSGIATVAQKVASELVQLRDIIITVETIGQQLNTPGADKARVAGPLVAQLILQSDMMIGQHIDNPDLFRTATTALAGNMADILNSFKPNVDTTNKA